MSATDLAPAEPALRVIVVDDEPAVRAMTIDALTHATGIEVVAQAENGDQAIAIADTVAADVMVVDVEMPYCDGPSCARRIHESHPELAIVAYTGHSDADTITRMIVAGAIGYAVKGHGPDDLVRAVRGAASHIVHVDNAALPGLFASVVRLARAEHARLLEVERLQQQLENSYEQTVKALAVALRARDNDTQDHVSRVTRMARLVGVRLGLDDQRLADLEYGAIFHDIGKIGLPDEILHNTDELSDEEWAIVRNHTVLGEEIIRPVGFLKGVATIVRHSHERWDGKGYPDGLAGEDIPLESRIIFACDAWDAMTSERSYQRALTHEQGVARVRELSGTHFDPTVVDVLLSFVAAEHAEV